MDVSGIASVATEMSQARTVDAVQIAVLKKALDIQAQMRLSVLPVSRTRSGVVPVNPPAPGVPAANQPTVSMMTRAQPL